MNLKLDYSKYRQLFSTTNTSYLGSDLFMTNYKKLHGLAVFSNNTWTTFLPEKVIKETLDDGLKLFKNTNKFSDFKNEIYSYYDHADKFFNDLLKKKEISLSECKQALNWLSDNHKYYSKTEFFYVDKAYQFKDSNKTIADNLKQFEKIKNTARLRMNKLLFSKDSHRIMFLKKISEQFSLPFQNILGYSKLDILNLYKGKKLPQVVINNRKKAYIHYSYGNKIIYFDGSEASKIANEFFSKKNHNEKEIRGIPVYKGKVRAKATVIEYGPSLFKNLKTVLAAMPKGNVLVADTTSPELLMACKKASAIVTNQGGMMSHAAIVSREFKIPCIVGTQNATQKIKDGDLVEVDADNGAVRILK